MKYLAGICIFLLFSAHSYAQKQQSDTWSNVPKAQDDRFTNPKSAIYAGPNGWWNYGEVRAEGTATSTLQYSFKGGLTTNSGIFNLNESGKLQILSLDFGTETPAPGNYIVANKANPTEKKVFVSLTDVANKVIKSWSTEGGSGVVVVTTSGDFIYFKARNLLLNPSSVYNKDEHKQTIKLGFEGAFKP